MSFETVIQSVIYPALNEDSALVALIGSDQVFDHVPQDTVFPYVVIGEDSHVEDDTDSTTGTIATVTIHSWSQQLGRGEIKQIQGLIYDALHNVTLTFNGYRISLCQFIGSDSFLDYDGISRHGVQTFRLFVESV